MKVKLTDKFNFEPQTEVNQRTNLPHLTGQYDVVLYFNFDPHDYWIELFQKNIHQRFQGDQPNMNIEGNQLSFSCGDHILPAVLPLITDNIKFTNESFAKWQVNKKSAEEQIEDHVKPIRDALEKQIIKLLEQCVE